MALLFLSKKLRSTWITKAKVKQNDPFSFQACLPTPDILLNTHQTIPQFLPRCWWRFFYQCLQTTIFHSYLLLFLLLHFRETFCFLGCGDQVTVADHLLRSPCNIGYVHPGAAFVNSGNSSSNTHYFRWFSLLLFTFHVQRRPVDPITLAII